MLSSRSFWHGRCVVVPQDGHSHAPRERWCDHPRGPSRHGPRSNCSRCREGSSRCREGSLPARRQDSVGDTNHDQTSNRYRFGHRIHASRAACRLGPTTRPQSFRALGPARALQWPQLGASANALRAHLRDAALEGDGRRSSGRRWLDRTQHGSRLAGGCRSRQHGLAGLGLRHGVGRLRGIKEAKLRLDGRATPCPDAHSDRVRGVSQGGSPPLRPARHRPSGPGRSATRGP